MRIALDARTIYRPIRRGTGKNLIDLYRTVARMRPDWHVLAYHRETDLGDLEGLLDEPNIEPRCIDMPGDRLHAWERWRLPLATWRDGADLLHCPANHCPIWMPTPTLVTIHDLIPLDLPRGRSDAELRHFEQSIRTAAKRAAGIVCPSQYTADRLVREFGADIAQITVNPWAADQSMQWLPREKCLAVTQRYGLDRPFVLHLGAPAPRKNTGRVLEAWALIGSSIRRKYQLLIVGLDGDSLAESRKRVENLGLTESVHLHGFADENDMPALFSAADVLAYPSLSEGFGLPILDAWATDTAVLSGDNTSLPEIAGDAAVQVDAGAPRNIAAGLIRLLRDRQLRQALTLRGRERLKSYTWNATAERFINAAEHVVGVCRRRHVAA